METPKETQKELMMHKVSGLIGLLVVLLVVTGSADVAEADAGYTDYGSYGGGGPNFRYMFFDNAAVSDSFSGNFLVLGGRGYAAITDWLRLGGGGFGSLTVVGDDDDNGAGDTDYDELTMGVGYGGFIVEPFLELASGLNVSLPILIGGGGYEFQYLAEELDDHEYRAEIYQGGFFALEPGLEITWKPIPYVGFALQGGYLLLLHDGEVFEGSGYAGVALYFGMP
jgi:hypothetical protein